MNAIQVRNCFYFFPCFRCHLPRTVHRSPFHCSLVSVLNWEIIIEIVSIHWMWSDWLWKIVLSWTLSLSLNPCLSLWNHRTFFIGFQFHLYHIIIFVYCISWRAGKKEKERKKIHFRLNKSCDRCSVFCDSHCFHFQ